MSNKRVFPVHTPQVVMAIAKHPISFNILQRDFRLSPSTLSRILKFLESNGCIKATRLKTGHRTGMKKSYKLTRKGLRLLPSLKRFADAKKAILKMH